MSTRGEEGSNLGEFYTYVLCEWSLQQIQTHWVKLSVTIDTGNIVECNHFIWHAIMANSRLPDKALALPSYTRFPTFLLRFSKTQRF